MVRDDVGPASKRAKLSDAEAATMQNDRSQNHDVDIVSTLDLDAVTVTATTSDTKWVCDASAIFERNGFCVIRAALCAHKATEILECCQQAEQQILERDPQLHGCRDAGRYSFGNATKSGSMLHCPAWRHSLDCQPVMDVLDSIFAEFGGYKFIGGGGDFVRAGTTHFQALHSDVGTAKIPADLRVIHPPPLVCVNFAVQPVTAFNGPMRIIPNKRRWNKGFKYTEPFFADEPACMRASRVFPLAAGDAIVRDMRVWHGGTPNVSDMTRHLPSVEVASTSYCKHLVSQKELWAVLPSHIFKILSTRCQDRCHPNMVAAPSDAVDEEVRTTFAKSQESWNITWSNWND